jgi:hypothetical protein
MTAGDGNLSILQLFTWSGLETWAFVSLSEVNMDGLEFAQDKHQSY